MIPVCTMAPKYQTSARGRVSHDTRVHDGIERKEKENSEGHEHHGVRELFAASDIIRQACQMRNYIPRLGLRLRLGLSVGFGHHGGGTLLRWWWWWRAPIRVIDVSVRFRKRGSGNEDRTTTTTTTNTFIVRNSSGASHAEVELP